MPTDRERALAEAILARAADTIPVPSYRVATVAQAPTADGTVAVVLDGDTTPVIVERLGTDLFAIGQRLLVLLLPPHGAYALGAVGPSAPAAAHLVYLVHADADSSTFTGATQRVVPFDTEDYLAADFAPTLSSGEVTPNEVGTFYFEWDVTADRTDAIAGDAEVQTWLELDPGGGGSFAEVDGTRSSVTLAAADEPGTITGRMVVEITSSSDIVRVVGALTVNTTTTGIFRADGCRFAVHRLPA